MGFIEVLVDPLETTPIELRLFLIAECPICLILYLQHSPQKGMLIR